MSTLIIYYLAGIVVAFSPCLFPVLPTFLTYVSAKKSARSRAFIASILFSIGLTLSFVTYSLLGVFAKELIMPLLTLSLENIVSAFGILLIGLGIAMFTPFKEITARISVPTLKVKGASLLDALLLGFLFSLLAAPCAAGSILAIVAGVILTSSGNFMSALATAMVQILLYSMGASTPFIILGALTQGISKKIHRRLSKSFLVRYNEPIMGILLIVYGIVTLFSLGNFVAYLDFANMIVEKISNISWFILWIYFAYSIFRIAYSFNDKMGILLSFSVLLDSSLLLIKTFVFTSSMLYDFASFLSRFLVVVSFAYYIFYVSRNSSVAEYKIISFIPMFLIGNIFSLLFSFINLVFVVEMIVFYFVTKRSDVKWFMMGVIIYIIYSYIGYVLNIVPHPYNELIKSLMVGIYLAFSFALFPVSYNSVSAINDIREIYEI